MNFNVLHQQIALTFLSGIGSRRARIIVSHFKDLHEFFGERRLNLAKIPGIPPNFVSLQHRMAALQEAEKAIEYLRRIGATTVFFTDPDYPRRLKQCDDAPLLLYAKGNIDWNPQKVLAVVGTRHATDYGRQLTRELVADLAGSGTVIVSGMAYGIDICAHLAALENGLPTIGVLGHGLHTLYPYEHRTTARQMLDCGGLISEFAPGMKPEPAYFPMRNRIVAGMADATIVVESGDKGGSLITAGLANDYSRDVFAFPGDVSRPFSAGCLRLIRENRAHLITGARDLINFMGWDVEKPEAPAQRHLFVELSAIEERIVQTLKTKKELAIDTIGYLASLSVAEVASHLLSLEFKGLVRSLPGKRYSLIPTV